MNIDKNINKLLYALTIKDKFYKINSFRFYNIKNNKYSTKYQILKRQIDGENAKIEYKEKYVADKECYSKVEIIKYLAEEYKKGSEADGR